MILSDEMAPENLALLPEHRVINSYHLECGEVFLPPDELLVFRSHCGDHIVEVHDDMHERVEHGKEGTVAACLRRKNCIIIGEKNLG